MKRPEIVARAPLLAGLATVLALALARSSLARLLPFELAGVAIVWLAFALLILLVPALLARATPLPAAILVAVPAIAAASYGASRLDWLRVLKDFGVAEETALDPIRLGLVLLAALLLWALHAADVAARFRGGAIARGIPRDAATRAAGRTIAKSTQAAAIAIVGALGLLGVVLVGLQLGERVPTGRAALAAPILAAALLVVAAVYLVRGARAG